MGTANPLSTLEISGTLGMNVQSVSSNTTLSGNSVVLATLSANTTLTLPAASSVTGRQYTIKKTSNSHTLAVVVASGGGNIDGNGKLSLTSSGNGYPFATVISDGSAWYILRRSSDGVALGAGAVAATGGTITTSGGYKIHTFNSSDTFTVTSGGTVEYLVVAGGGGGGGGYQGGGGGAGGYLASASQAVTARTYAITVGAGGNGCTNSPDVAATNGGNSVIQDIATATGGGRGGSESPSAAPNTGGSGGGGSWDGTTQNTGAAGTAGPPIQGYAGGDGYAIFPYGDNNFPGGGGGGSAGVGTNGVNTVAQTDGGPGTSNSISGGAVTYAAGGKGANRGRNANGTNASANTGNGGESGGKNTSNSTGGNGGSGIVIIRYLSP